MDEQIFLDWQVHFNLRKPNSRRATLIYAVATLWGQQIKVSTGVKVYALVKQLRLEEMIAQVLSMLELAKQALQEESQELATAVFAKDNMLDEINAEATAILADYISRHPESALSCLNLVSVFRKLERSGDHITNIAEEIVFFIDAKVLKHSGRTDEHYLNDKK